MHTPRTVAKKMLKEFGIADFSADLQEELIANIGAVIYENTMLRVFGSLSEEKQTALTKLLEASIDDPRSEDKQRAIYTYLAREVHEMQQIVAEEVAALKTLYEDAERDGGKPSQSSASVLESKDGRNADEEHDSEHEPQK